MSNHICPKCETAVIAAWRQEIDGNYYHDRCLPFRGLLNHAESELIAANARIAELEQEKADTVLRMTTWAANTLHTCHEQCERPLCVANRRIAALEALLGEAPHTWACHKVMSVDTETGAPIHLSDRVGCSCFKSRA